MGYVITAYARGNRILKVIRLTVYAAACQAFREAAQGEDCTVASIQYPNGETNWTRGRASLIGTIV